MQVDKLSDAAKSLLATQLKKPNDKGDLSTEPGLELSGNAESVSPQADTKSNGIPFFVRISQTSSGQGFSMPLSENIHLLGDLLGQVILEHAGEVTFNAVEDLRGIAKEMRSNPSLDHSQEIKNIVQRLDLDTSTKVLRAFTIYFHLVNEAEKNEIVRVNRERELAATTNSPRKEAIAQAVSILHERNVTPKELQSLLNKLDIQPVFTAHPTEAKRPELITALNTISTLTKKRDTTKLTTREHKDLLDEVKRQITLLWLTPEVRPSQPTVQEEAENTLYFLRDTVFPLIPKLHADLQGALATYYPEDNLITPAFFHIGSWVGGDRDGNPNVTPEVTRDVVILHASTVLRKYIEQVKILRNELSLAGHASQPLVSSIQQDSAFIPPDHRTLKLYEQEPYRLKLWFIEKKLENTLSDIECPKSNCNSLSNTRYDNAKEFLQELNLILESLNKNNASIIASTGTLSNLILQVSTFGFHLGELDVRQHSDEHQTAVNEILLKTKVTDKQYKDLSDKEKADLITKILQNPSNLISQNIELSDKTKQVLEGFKVISELHKKIGKESIRCYVISFTQGVSDLLEVLFLAKEAGLVHASKESESTKLKSDIDIVPLFETVEDLRNAGELLTNLFSNSVYQEHLKSRNNFQEIMLGYSDSNKDGGYLSANVELYKAQRTIVDACRKHNITWRFFHGRGGSIGRGGGQAGKAIQALPHGSVEGKMRLTEQGEVLSSRYSQVLLAHRHLESITNSVLLASLTKEETKENNEEPWIELLSKLAETARIHYRQLVYEEPDFWSFYTQATPISFISQLRIASRPASRRGLEKVEDLRAIPWVFSWTQTRMMIPSWYGVGTALNEVAKHDGGLELLQNMYKNWPFFNTVINNCQTAVAKADMHTASQYITLVEPQENGRMIFGKITEEYELTRKMLLRVTTQNEILDNAPVIQKSIQLRNPYTDPLNYIQVELLKRLRQPNNPDNEKTVSAILLSINGIAAAMQETG